LISVQIGKVIKGDNNSTFSCCPDLTLCASIFIWISRGEYMNNFSGFLGIQTFIYVRFMRVIYALEVKCLEEVLSKALVGEWFFLCVRIFWINE